MARTKPSRRGKQVAQRRRAPLRILIGVGIFALLGLVIVLNMSDTPEQSSGAANDQEGAAASVDLPHVHGMGYSAEGQQLTVAAHSGLRVYKDGAWSVPDVPVNDYMGFAPTDQGFYSSGHPGPSSSLPNPLGLVKSTDGGRTLTTLAFAGESDFHLMGVGYQSHAIYVVAEQPNSQLDVGMHYSLDDGRSWQESALRGVEGPLIQVAVHPSDPATVAVAGESGLYLSTDSGATFERVVEQGPVSAAVFSPDGSQIFFGTTTLSAYNVQTGEQTTLQAPALRADDVINFLAVNPTRPTELALATYARDIFISANNGQSWTQVARDGQGMSAQP